MVKSYWFKQWYTWALIFFVLLLGIFGLVSSCVNDELDPYKQDTIDQRVESKPVKSEEVTKVGILEAIFPSTSITSSNATIDTTIGTIREQTVYNFLTISIIVTILLVVFNVFRNIGMMVIVLSALTYIYWVIT